MQCFSCRRIGYGKGDNGVTFAGSYDPRRGIRVAKDVLRLSNERERGNDRRQQKRVGLYPLFYMYIYIERER